MSQYLREDAEKLKFWRGIFGKLQLHYTPSKISSELNGQIDTVEYRVIAKDQDSVAIVLWNLLLEKEVISHIHFHGKHYWVAIGPFREFFKRVTHGSNDQNRAPNKSLQRTRPRTLANARSLRARR